MPAPRGLVQQLDQQLHRSGLLKPGQRLLVACSGGADSVALLHLLHAINQSDYWHWSLTVAHINHQIRGPLCDADAQFTQRLAAQLNIPFASETLSLPLSGRGVISEATSRRARYAAFQRMAQAHRAHAIVLAHHADDQAETVLMRLIRGCGIRGLRGISPRQKIANLTLLRPLLSFDRSTLQRYLQSIHQPWCDDHTNRAPEFLRNRIRHELLPLLENYQPRTRLALTRLAEQARDAHAAIRTEIRQLRAQKTLTATAEGLTLVRAPLRTASLAAVGGLLRLALKQLGANADQIHYDHLRRAARALQRGRAGIRLQFPAGITFRLHRDTAQLTRSSSPAHSSPARGRSA